MKKGIALLLALAMLLPACALAAGGSVLLLDMPQDAQMIENIEFDDGDFIQSYQLAGGANVQLLRYAAFDMTLGDLLASEWAGCTNVRELALEPVGGYPAQGLRFCYQGEGQDALDVTLILIDAGDATLVFQAVYPRVLGDAQIDAALQDMILSMNVLAGDAAVIDETAEVG